MSTSPLTVLRLAHRSQPSLADVAKKCGVSKQAVGLFELGRTTLSEETMRRYAKALGSTLADVRSRYLQAAYMFHAERARDIRIQLAATGKKPRPGRRPKHFQQASS